MSDILVLSTPLGGSPLAVLAQQGGAPPWYALAPRDGAGWRARGGALARWSAERDWLSPLAGALPREGAAAERLARAAAGGFVVTTGQQPGLFGGPIYTWNKALSTLALADALQALCGVPVAPVFWAATDDADYAEAATTNISVEGGVRTLSMPPAAERDVPLCEVPLPDVRALLDVMASASGAALWPEVFDMVRATVEANATVGGAYVDLLRRVLGPRGVAVLDAGHPDVARAARRVLELALERAPDVDAALIERERLLREAGAEPQVARVPGLSLVFTRTHKRRVRLPITDARRALDRGAHPSLSANVLLRPVVERAVMPTVAYVAGPGELAYFAQVGAVADALGLDVPVAAPRWSGLIIEPHIWRILRRHGLQHTDLRDPHEAETQLARRGLPASVRERLAAVREGIRDALAELERTLDSEDPQLPAAVLRGAERDMLRRAERLERRIVAAAKRREESLMRDLGTARAALYPLGRPQERVLNLLPLLARHGPALLDLMQQRASEHAARLSGGPAPGTENVATRVHGRLSRTPGG